MIKGEVDPEIHVEQMIHKLKSQMPPIPSLTKVHHPLQHPDLFEKDAQRAAGVCNYHQHSSTCHSGNAGKKGCRLSRPQALIQHTTCCQIKPRLPSKEDPKSK